MSSDERSTAVRMSRSLCSKSNRDVSTSPQEEAENLVKMEIPESPELENCKPMELPTKTRLRIIVKKLHVTAEWKWIDGGEDTCGICRMDFEAACTNCKFPGDTCPLIVGTCRHAFHQHCIEKWTAAPTNQPRAQCPLCRQEWVVDASKNPVTDGAQPIGQDQDSNAEE